MDKVIRFFTDELSGDECAIILRNGEEICVTADEGWDVEAQSQAHHDAYILSLERGYL
jgi:peptidoglycan/xylan/chitin deacetylase (PgdA/CDA1 family)